jgi:hypothetical protein
MHTLCGDIELGASRGQKTRFCSEFKQKMRRRLARRLSAAEEFGIVWQKTLDQVPLEDLEQAEVYWALIKWARVESYSQYVAVSGRDQGLVPM